MGSFDKIVAGALKKSSKTVILKNVLFLLYPSKPTVNKKLQSYNAAIWICLKRTKAQGQFIIYIIYSRA